MLVKHEKTIYHCVSPIISLTRCWSIFLDGIILCISYATCVIFDLISFEQYDNTLQAIKIYFVFMVISCTRRMSHTVWRMTYGMLQKDFTNQRSASFFEKTFKSFFLTYGWFLFHSRIQENRWNGHHKADSWLRHNHNCKILNCQFKSDFVL